MSYGYLASPYSSPDPLIRQRRYEIARSCVTYLCKRTSQLVFSPVVYGHHLEQSALGKMPHSYWMRHARAMLAKASNLLVLVTDGTAESKGVQEEIILADRLNVSISYIGLRKDRYERDIVVRLSGLNEPVTIQLDDRTLQLLDRPEPLNWD